ncbi:universal stress protein [Noviherbaspirillum galbum]|uniref:Universal stress protein n=1 Tax=Noviherbaspirillum galbum TaxID=2709383 RepID=A0A6B3SXN2_9BURK|nr:universal stress protein [Noviherbaspirillum galbum]NEX63282.1 universal stress protein [Noviherbaspirillum galbum]
MYRSILLCYDGSVEGRNALREGAEVAQAMQAQTTLLAILRPGLHPVVPEGYTESWFTHQDAAARAVLEEGVGWLRERGIAAEGRIAVGNAVEEIVAAAHALAPDLIVVAHQQRSRLARWWSDGEDATLLDRLTCSVLVAVIPPAQRGIP